MSRGGNFTATAEGLADKRRWLQHSQPIDYIEAKRLGLNISCVESTQELWQSYWALYCEQRLCGLPDDARLLGSEIVSIPM